MKLLTAVFFQALIASIQHASCQLSEESCTNLSNQLLRQLKALRIAFAEIKDYFQAKDDELDILLLKDNLLEDFKGCQSVSDMIRFYLEEVLPKAINSSKDVKRNVGTIGNMLLDLRKTLKRFLLEKLPSPVIRVTCLDTYLVPAGTTGLLKSSELTELCKASKPRIEIKIRCRT